MSYVEKMNAKIYGDDYGHLYINDGDALKIADEADEKIRGLEMTIIHLAACLRTCANTANGGLSQYDLFKKKK